MEVVLGVRFLATAHGHGPLSALRKNAVLAWGSPGIAGIRVGRSMQPLAPEIGRGSCLDGLRADTVAAPQSSEVEDEHPGPLPVHVHDDRAVCFGPEGNRRVSEIWASREQFEAFGERLMPAIQEAGMEMETEPEVLEIYSQIRG